MISPSDRRRILTGILIIVVGSAIFGAVDGFSKILADNQSVAQIVWARYALAFPVLLLTRWPSEWLSVFKTRRPYLQIVRGLTPLVISAGMVLGVRYLPLADATVILFAGPFFVVALSAPLLGERVRPSSWIGVIVGFLAGRLVARPGFSDLSAYSVFPLVAAVFYALLQLVTRALGASGEKATTTLAWTLAVGGLASTPFAIAGWEPVDAHGWLLMLCLGIVFGFGQLLIAAAFTYAPASVLTPFSYSQIIAAVIFGIVVFDATPDRFTLAGVVLIIAAGVYVVRSRAT